MKVILIRHGMTRGNTEGRYIGVTEESLCEAGRQTLKDYMAAGIYPPAAQVVVSPMLRCRETAALLYPEQSPLVVDDFRECDFGTFEGKNYKELTGNADYQRWIDSGGVLPFPQGESREAFQGRCVRAFAGVMAQLAGETGAIVLIVHGGTIMSIMEHYFSSWEPAAAAVHPMEYKSSYYDFQVKNGLGYMSDYIFGRFQNVQMLQERIGR